MATRPAVQSRSYRRCVTSWLGDRLGCQLRINRLLAQSVDVGLDLITQSVDRLLDAVLNTPAALCRDLRLPATVADILSDGIVVIAAVGEQDAALVLIAA